MPCEAAANTDTMRSFDFVIASQLRSSHSAQDHKKLMPLASPPR
jgi:hypothetical protein